MVFHQKYHIFQDKYHLFGHAGDVTPRCIFSGQWHLFFQPAGHIMLVTPTHIYRKCHISMSFLIKIMFFYFAHQDKISYFLEKRNTIFPDITKKTMFRCEFLGKTIISEHLKKISNFQVFSFRERSSFLLCLRNKIIFLGKWNIVFPDNTRKIIFQCNFSKHLEKENTVFRAVY